MKKVVYWRAPRKAINGENDSPGKSASLSSSQSIYSEEETFLRLVQRLLNPRLTKDSLYQPSPYSRCPKQSKC